MDWPLLGFTLIVFLGAWMAGRAEHRRLVRQHHKSTIGAFHKEPGWVRFLLLALVGLIGVSFYFVLHRYRLWNMPDWLDQSLLWWTNGFGSMLFGLLLGLAWGAWRREQIPNARALALTAFLCEFVLLFSSAVGQRFVADELNDLKMPGRVLRQTTGYSCAPTSGANIAGLLGLSFSEKEMARLMKTRASGTSPAAILRGMRAAGLEGAKFELHPIILEAIPLPAILIVDHVTGGAESHAVAAVKYHADTKALEIWDPDSGRKWLLAQAQLARIWQGRGIAFKRANP